MDAGMYEARSLDHPERVAYVLIESGDRLAEHRMRRALEQIADAPKASSVGAVARWALEGT